MLIFCISTFLFLGECKRRELMFELSVVTVKVKGEGNIKLFSDKFFQAYNHCEIYLNDNFYDEDKNEFFFNSTNSENLNIIQIIWNDTIQTTENMFENCNTIIEIDLSNFDTSKVSNMSKMFSNCLSLISLNLSNFNTSLANDMSFMFNNCSSLISLNLSSFDKSRAINMTYMFYNCMLFTSLDLSNFDTSNVNTMN